MAITLPLLLAAGDCYFVTNTRTLVLPTCDIGPATIERLAGDAAPERSIEAARRRNAGPYRGGVARSVCTTVVRGSEELERRLELAEQERVTAEVARLAAEQERDVALRQREQALDELRRARMGRPAAAGPQPVKGAGTASRHLKAGPGRAASDGAPARAQAGG
jgi:hypothetical protein